MKQIILIEDDPLDAMLAKRSLRTLTPEFNIVHLKDGQAFLNYLQQPGNSKIYLVIMDLKMPRVGGIEVLEYLTAEPQRPRFPIVVFSSSQQATDIHKCYALGCNAYVSKPINYKEYSEVMETISTFWIETNRIPYH